MSLQNPSTQDRILRLPDVIKTTGLSRSTIYSHIKENLFPSPINLGARCVGWIESEVNDWIQSRIKESRS
ncbi:MAG: AlpA family transcriptional regulator [Alphaproteobacteria bacterium]|nr:AlpA family transcriptional regulator [Alphaproteobacteria bacterium]